jgi:hypothetical protein
LIHGQPLSCSYVGSATLNDIHLFGGQHDALITVWLIVQVKLHSISDEALDAYTVGGGGAMRLHVERVREPNGVHDFLSGRFKS